MKTIEDWMICTRCAKNHATHVEPASNASMDAVCNDCAVPFTEVSVISEYGLDQKLTNSIRVF